MSSVKVNYRISSLDFLRGVVIVIMALDHVRDYFHYDAFFFDPTDLSQTNPILFFTRFITHFCAPVFVFLAGTSAYLVGQRKGKKALSIWLLKRGIWLVIVELTIIKFAWNFALDFSVNALQVIWVLGISMIFLAAFIHLPRLLTLALCLLGVFAHNAFDTFVPSEPVFVDIWNLLHNFGPINLGATEFFVAYPMIPWIFVMPLGYYFGQLYTEDTPKKIRMLWLVRISIIAMSLFLIIRFLNIYGDPFGWQSYESLVFTILSFINLTKYPPSLLYLLITLGPSIFLLSQAEHWRGKAYNALVLFGRVPMFFYIVHIYVIHLIALLAAELSGYSWKDMIIKLWVTLEPQLQGYGFDLYVVYILWILIVIALFPLCKWYNTFKSNNRQYWILSYF